MSTGYTQMRLSPQQLQRRRKIVDPVQHALEAGRLDEAQALATAALKKLPGDAQLHLMLAAVAERTGQSTLVRHHGRKALGQGPNAGAFAVLSRLERRMANTDLAVELCDKALELVPGDVPLRIHRVGCLEEAGRVDEARGVAQELESELAGKGQELPPHLRFELAKLDIQDRAYDSAERTLGELAEETAAPVELRSMAQYIRAKALDRAGKFDEAFAAAARANEMSGRPFDPDAYEQRVGEIIQTWSKPDIAAYPVTSCQSEAPVFIAGMPRSGTSLLDQIIDAHPQAAGVGELDTIERFAHQLEDARKPDAPADKRFGSLNRFRWQLVADDYVREISKLAPGAERVANKAIGNTRLVGLLTRLFPKTRIVHIRRDPRDVAISCFMGAFNNDALPWTTKLDWVARAYPQSERLMDHWKQTLDVPILEVRYEELVADPGTQFPRLIEFLGLPWDDACRDFYKTRRTVKTLSYDQVNRPLYTSSAGRHRNYLQHLQDVAFPAYP